MRLVSVFRLPVFIALLSPMLLQAQVVSSASERSLPVSFGVGLTGVDPDMLESSGNIWKTQGSGIMLGVTGWGDYYPRWMPHALLGLGMEGEVHDINFHKSNDEKDIRQTSIGAGAIYTWRHFAYFRPYAKVGIALGRVEFGPSTQAYRSDTRTVTNYAGGFEYRVWGHIWARSEFEYQTWPDLLAHGTFRPESVTVGASYHFGHVRPR